MSKRQLDELTALTVALESVQRRLHWYDLRPRSKVSKRRARNEQALRDAIPVLARMLGERLPPEHRPQPKHRPRRPR